MKKKNKKKTTELERDETVTHSLPNMHLQAPVKHIYRNILTKHDY